MDAAAVWSTERRDDAAVWSTERRDDASGTLGSSYDLEPTMMRDNGIRRADTIVSVRFACFCAKMSFLLRTYLVEVHVITTITT